MMNYKEFKNKLEEEIKIAKQVFIIGHNFPDFDSLGSALGLYHLVKSFEKKAYIIIDDDFTTLEPGVKKILDENKSHYKIIKKEDYEKLVNKHSLLVLTDVNKKSMISIENNLEKIKKIMIIDHHSENALTLETDKKFISTDVSSASEIVSRILLDFKIKIPTDLANFLLAGINLDTKRFKQNTNSQTLDTARKLLAKGADIDYVNNLFLEEFESYARISNLIINGTIIQKYSENSLAPINVSFTINRNMPKTIYKMEDYAKAADRMLEFRGIDAAFALGYINENTIHISARSGKKVNVGRIMSQMDGGGNNQSAGGKIYNQDIIEVENLLKKQIIFGLPDDEDVYEEPKVIKVKQIPRLKKH